MAFSPETMKILENVYWFVCAFLLGAGIYVVWKQNKQVEAVLLTIIGGAAIFYYWIKWFKIVDKSNLWPPYVNPCPDYLTLVTPEATGAPDHVCMDFVGVSSEPNMLRKTDPNKIPQASDGDFENYSFKVEKTRPNETPDAYNKRVCLQVQSKGLSWAGVCE
jgi:hypothetical protein